MSITVLFFDTLLIFLLTFVYCSFRLSSKASLEEYEKDNN